MAVIVPFCATSLKLGIEQFLHGGAVVGAGAGFLLLGEPWSGRTLQRQPHSSLQPTRILHLRGGTALLWPVRPWDSASGIPEESAGSH